MFCMAPAAASIRSGVDVYLSRRAKYGCTISGCHNNATPLTGRVLGGRRDGSIMYYKVVDMYIHVCVCVCVCVCVRVYVYACSPGSHIFKDNGLWLLLTTRY